MGSNNSGYYTLYAVLTHQGRSSSSGHYVGWVRQSTTEDKWVKFDDDVVSPITSEEILRLSGGGDWHCKNCLNLNMCPNLLIIYFYILAGAYVLLYGPRILQIPIEEKKTEGEATDAATTQPMQE